MARYEYRCDACGEFEREQPIDAKPLRRCPKCGNYCRRLISRSTFVLRGGGWPGKEIAAK